MNFRAGTEMARKKVARKRRQQENFKHTKAKHYKHPQASVALNCECKYTCSHTSTQYAGIILLHILAFYLGH